MRGGEKREARRRPVSRARRAPSSSASASASAGTAPSAGGAYAAAASVEREARARERRVRGVAAACCLRQTARANHCRGTPAPPRGGAASRGRGRAATAAQGTQAHAGTGREPRQPRGNARSCVGASRRDFPLARASANARRMSPLACSARLFEGGRPRRRLHVPQRASVTRRQCAHGRVLQPGDGGRGCDLAAASHARRRRVAQRSKQQGGRHDARRGAQYFANSCAEQSGTFLASTMKNKTHFSEFQRRKDMASDEHVCLYPGCVRRAAYGAKSDEEPKVCHLHKNFRNLGLVKVTSFVPKKTGLCTGKREDGSPCTTRASFGVAGTTAVLFCKTHKPVGYVSLAKPVLCTGTNEDGTPCTTHASFGLPGTTKKLFCKTSRGRGHAPPPDRMTAARSAAVRAPPRRCTRALRYSSCGLREPSLSACPHDNILHQQSRCQK